MASTCLSCEVTNLIHPWHSSETHAFALNLRQIRSGIQHQVITDNNSKRFHEDVTDSLQLYLRT